MLEEIVIYIEAQMGWFTSSPDTIVLFKNSSREQEEKEPDKILVKLSTAVSTHF